MAAFKLNNIEGVKDVFTGRLNFTQSKEYKVGILIYSFAYLTSFIAEGFGADWLSVPAMVVALLALVIACIPLSFSRNAGTAHLKETEILIKPKKNPEAFPASPVRLEELSEVEINMVSSFRWLSSYVVLQFILHKEDRAESFGLTIKNKKEEEQYLGILDSWYRSGFPVKEYNELGSRVFKLDKGKNYDEIQKIKREYDIKWT